MFDGNYNPYFTSNRSAFMGFKKINWSSLLNNTQKTLNIINQAIPIVYQVKPILNNAKTMFKVISAVKDDTPTTNTKEESIKDNTEEIHPNNRPVFYI